MRMNKVESPTYNNIRCTPRATDPYHHVADDTKVLNDENSHIEE